MSCLLVSQRHWLVFVCISIQDLNTVWQGSHYFLVTCVFVSKPTRSPSVFSGAAETASVWGSLELQIASTILDQCSGILKDNAVASSSIVPCHLKLCSLSLLPAVLKTRITPKGEKNTLHICLSTSENTKLHPGKFFNSLIVSSSPTAVDLRDHHSPRSTMQKGAKKFIKS